MIDHVGVRVRDLARAVAFYREALAPIGYSVLMEFPGAVGLGAGGKPDFWLSQGEQEGNPTHLAFSADREAVDEFHRAALEAGGKDNGGPGLRPDYHANYYAAFILDPEGNNVEVVSHDAPARPQPKAPPAPAKRPSAAAKRPAAKKPPAPRSAATRKGAGKNGAAKNGASAKPKPATKQKPRKRR